MIAPGIRFDRLLVLGSERVKRKVSKKRDWHYRCRCDCGVETSVRGDKLRSRTTRSCGCLSLETLKANGETWRATLKEKARVRWKDPTEIAKRQARSAWLNMRKRCEDSKHSAYAYYGARGISIFPAWQDFSVFVRALGLPKPKQTLERRDNALGYTPENCYWASWEAQANNKRNTLLVCWEGGSPEPFTLLCRRLGVPSEQIPALRQRFRNGWPLKKLLEIRVRGKRKSHSGLRNEF